MAHLNISIHLSTSSRPTAEVVEHSGRTWLELKMEDGEITIFTRDRAQAEALKAAFCPPAPKISAEDYPAIERQILERGRSAIHPEDGRPLDAGLADELEEDR